MPESTPLFTIKSMVRNPEIYEQWSEALKHTDCPDDIIALASAIASNTKTDNPNFGRNWGDKKIITIALNYLFKAVQQS
ncbi:hypothetical protein [Aulosira sp. FACHB-615]|uniref:hypothetical protein n=1 Tax=Aulosira sp. FACHB-615 TaxID=2692777 RepID=UPI00168388A4|nr:hypothetical protein [Aulosira sp. FACHB-615]